VPGIKQLENFIDFCSVKNKIISKNIANVGTQNYKREEVSFKEVLKEAQTVKIRDLNPKFIEIQSTGDNPFERAIDPNTEAVSGVNNVDIEREMAELAENTLKFKFSARKISSYYSSIRSVIKGGSEQ
jgi:flagellar basal-body rod protein FlgB